MLLQNLAVVWLGGAIAWLAQFHGNLVLNTTQTQTKFFFSKIEQTSLSLAFGHAQVEFLMFAFIVTYVGGICITIYTWNNIFLIVLWYFQNIMYKSREMQNQYFVFIYLL